MFGSDKAYMTNNRGSSAARRGSRNLSERELSDEIERETEREQPSERGEKAARNAELNRRSTIIMTIIYQIQCFFLMATVPLFPFPNNYI